MDEHDSEAMRDSLSGEPPSSDARLADARDRISKLEAELSAKRGEVEALRAARARDAAALAQHDQVRAELESLQDEHAELQLQLGVQRTRGDELAGLLATERSWGDELERLLKDARARGDRLERELADERSVGLAHELYETEDAWDSPAAAEIDAALAAGLADRLHGAARADELDTAQDALDRAHDASGTGGAPLPAPPAERITAPRWSHSAQLHLTAAQAGCRDWHSVVTETVRIVGSEGGWEAVIAWALDQRDNHYTCRATWCRAPDRMASFETAMWQVRQAGSGSPISDVATAAEPQLLSGLDAAADPHLTTIARAGMHTVVLVPVRHGLETAAVLELCTRAELNPDPELDIAVRVIAAGLANLHQLLTTDRTPQWGDRRYRL